jgi:hypothetical protein
MRMPSAWRTLVLTVSLLALLGAGSALAASNTVPASRLDNITQGIGVPDLAPPECAAIASGLSNLVIIGSGSPGNGSDLIIGTSGADTITAGRGSDCIVAGGGDDTVNGNQGSDVLLGGPGNDDLDGGAGTDACHGGPGTDTVQRCESTTGIP